MRRALLLVFAGVFIAALSGCCVVTTSAYGDHEAMVMKEYPRTTWTTEAYDWPTSRTTLPGHRHNCLTPRTFPGFEPEEGDDSATAIDMCMDECCPVCDDEDDD